MSSQFILLDTEQGTFLKAGEADIGRFEMGSNDAFDCRDSIRIEGGGVLLWERTYTARQNATGRIEMDFRAFHTPDFWMIPAMCYNGNPFGHGNDIKGFFHNKEAYTYATHRASLPGGTYSEGRQWCVGVMAAEPEGSFSLFPQGDRSVVHRLIWPEEERPVHYVERKKMDGKRAEVYADGFANKADWSAGDTFTKRAYVVVAPVGRMQRRAYRQFVDFGWRSFREADSRQQYTPEEIWNMGRRFACETLWDDEVGFFSTGLRFVDGRWTRARKYASGFVGQNLSLANSILYDSLISNDARSHSIAERCLKNWINRSLLPSGLFIGAHGPDGAKEGHANANHMGKSCEQFFEAARLQTEAGGDGDAFQSAALRICAFALEQQEPSGLIPGNWDLDGSPLDRRGTIGSCFISPCVIAYETTGEPRFLDAARRAFDYCIDFFRKNGFLGGATLDTFCIERESGFSMVVGGLRLYKATGEKAFLEAAEEAAYYVATWQFCYKAPPYPEGTPLAQIDYNTRGGTAVATVHPCMDFHALEIMDDFYTLGEWFQKPIWKERALSAWKHAQQGISDGSLAFMDRPPRPYGSQDETWFYTHWGLWAQASSNAVPEHPRGHVSQWLVAKPTAGRMEFLRRLGKANWPLLEADPSIPQSTPPTLICDAWYNAKSAS